MAIQIHRPSMFLVVCMAYAVLVIGGRATTNDRKVYIVYMGELPGRDFPALSQHAGILEEVTGSHPAESLLRSYSRSFNAFSAKLTYDEMLKVERMNGVVSVFPSETRLLHTTRSWDFIGFPSNVQRRAIERDLIVGVIDSGIWPESESFNDKGFGPPPKRWKGACQRINFTCNNKIIGARYYRQNHTLVNGDILSPRDTKGHGTHTSSTAAGGLVKQASFFGLAGGSARGAVPSARIAVYKACWLDGCYDADILAAFDDAIADGVDVISYSNGGSVAFDYFKDVLTIGSFHAMRKGILTSTSAGNNGPKPSSVNNVAPWVITVGASITDRKFGSKVRLGNGKMYEGLSVNTFPSMPKSYPIIYGGNAPDASKGANSTMSRYCSTNTLDSTLVKGKIVVCDSVSSAEGALNAGAVGSIMQDSYYKDDAYIYPLPATYLSSQDGAEVMKYLNSTRTAVASIFKTTHGRDANAPYVASFSSRGPSNITSDILKPDIVAPGVDILAAWSRAAPVTTVAGDNRHAAYNIYSGTSMACPHVTGAAAYVKSYHSTWSPAAIKSALMTTATPLNPAFNTEAELAYGSGQVNPIKALDPGMVYDANEDDYVKFLCGQGYNTSTLRLVTGDSSSCSQSVPETVWDLNYPSFALKSPRTRSVERRIFHRTVTNVGRPISTYTALVLAPKGLQIEVVPKVLTFSASSQKKSFHVTVTAELGKNYVLSGSLTWFDGVHKVRSPIIAF